MPRRRPSPLPGWLRRWGLPFRISRRDLDKLGVVLTAAGIRVPPRCVRCGAHAVAVVPIPDPPTRWARRFLVRKYAVQIANGAESRSNAEIPAVPTLRHSSRRPRKAPLLVGAVVHYRCGGARVLNGASLTGRVLRPCEAPLIRIRF